MLAALSLQLPIARIGRPKEIAEMVLFVASDECRFSTGAEFVADGGGTATFTAPPGGSWLDNGASWAR